MIAYDARTTRWQKNLRVPFAWKTSGFPAVHFKSRGSAELVAWCPYFELERPVRRKTYHYLCPDGQTHRFGYPSKNSRLMHRLGLECVTCGSKAAYYVLVHAMGKNMVWALTEDGVPFTLDHHIPRAHGGSNRAHNLQVMCDACNQRKGSKHPNELA